MTNRIKSALASQTLTKLPNNTTEQVGADDLRSVLTDYTDSCFRDPAYLIEAGNGRLLLESGDGYLTLEGVTP